MEHSVTGIPRVETYGNKHFLWIPLAHFPGLLIQMRLCHEGHSGDGEEGKQGGESVRDEREVKAGQVKRVL